MAGLFMTMTSVFKISAAGLALVMALACVSSAEPNFAGGLYFNTGFPQGEFKDQIDRNAYGLSGQFFYSPHQSPLAIGIEGGWMNYGSESRREPFSTTIPDVTVNVTTSNNIAQVFLIVRGQVPNGPIRLYGDALIGLNYLFTETKITDSDEPDDEVASSTNKDDAVFAYGFGGGVMVPVYTRPAGPSRPIQVLIDGGVRYILGGEAEYLKEGSIRRENGMVTYDVIKSETDMVRLHIGVMIRF
jgi:hypothetical protein